MKFAAHVTALIALLGVATDAASFERRFMATQTAVDNKQIAREIYETCINAGRLELIDQLVSPGFEGPDGSRGPAAFRANVEALRRGFPDIRFTVHDVIGEGDRVVVRWSWEATHDGPFRGIAPTHKRVTNTGIVIYQFRDGKVVRNWLETDRLGALQQIGAAPPSVAQPAK